MFNHIAYCIIGLKWYQTDKDKPNSIYYEVTFMPVKDRSLQIDRSFTARFDLNDIIEIANLDGEEEKLAKALLGMGDVEYNTWKADGFKLFKILYHRLYHQHAKLSF